MRNHDNEIEKTLQSLDEVKGASPGPYFYTRLKARMDKQERGNGILSMPVLRIAAAFLLAMNITLAVLMSGKKIETEPDSIEQLSSDYFNAEGALYTFNQELLEDGE